MIDQADKTNGTEKDIKLETLNYVLFGYIRNKFERWQTGFHKH